MFTVSHVDIFCECNTKIGRENLLGQIVNTRTLKRIIKWFSFEFGFNWMNLSNQGVCFIGSQKKGEKNWETKLRKS